MRRQAMLADIGTGEKSDTFGNMETISAVASLSALAQETRLDVYRLLVRAGRSGMPAGRIGE